MFYVWIFLKSNQKVDETIMTNRKHEMNFCVAHTKIRRLEIMFFGLLFHSVLV